MKHYTIGEIFRLGLLKNFDGEPYKHKASLSKIVNALNPGTKKTPWGEAKTLSDKVIKEYNQKNINPQGD